MAAEVQFAEHCSFQGEYGLSWLQIAPNLNKDITNMDSDIWHVEFRRYFDYKNEKGRYFAIDYFQKNQTYNRLWTTAQTNGGQFVTTEQWLAVQRDERAVNLIFGYQSNQNQQRKFLFEGYFGIGVKARKVDNNLSENWKLVNTKWDLLDDKKNRIIPNVMIGLKIGFQVWNFRKYHN